MKRVLIIGGSGFLGSHISDHLSKGEHNVTIFDSQKPKYLNKIIVPSCQPVDFGTFFGYTLKNKTYVIR